MQQDLSRAGYNGLSLHGGKDQTDRDFTIADFKNKAATLMVATSVAGRSVCFACVSSWAVLDRLRYAPRYRVMFDLVKSCCFVEGLSSRSSCPWLSNHVSSSHLS